MQFQTKVHNVFLDCQISQVFLLSLSSPTISLSPSLSLSLSLCLSLSLPLSLPLSPLSLSSTTFGFIGDTALHTRITESFIKHCSWYFGLAPSLYTSALDSKTSSSSSQQEREDEEETIQTRDEEDEDKESIRSAEVVSPTENQTEEDENGDRESPTNSSKHWSHDCHMVIM